jgi:hypothetical protein
LANLERLVHLKKMADRSPDESLTAALESSRNIKLGRGVVSKTSYVAALALAVWGFIAWRLGDDQTTNAMLLGVGLVVTEPSGSRSATQAKLCLRAQSF